MLAHGDRDRRQLGNLVALRRRRVDLLLGSEGSRARLAALRPVVDDHVQPLGRQQPSVAALVSGLAAAASARSRLLRARRRRQRILRGRQRRVMRAAVEPPLQLRDAGLEPPVRLDQLAHTHQVHGYGRSPGSAGRADTRETHIPQLAPHLRKTSARNRCAGHLALATSAIPRSRSQPTSTVIGNAASASSKPQRWKAPSPSSKDGVGCTTSVHPPRRELLVRHSKMPLSRDLLMGRAGIEPATLGLKVQPDRSQRTETS